MLDFNRDFEERLKAHRKANETMRKAAPYWVAFICFMGLVGFACLVLLVVFGVRIIGRL